MLPCNISPSLAIPHERHHNIMLPCNISPLWQSLVNGIICYRATLPPLAIPHERAYVTVQHFPLWQSIVNSIAYMLPCNISRSLAIPREQHHNIMLPCNISPLWQSLVNEHHMLPCNISPSLAIPRERASQYYVTVQHFPSLAIPRERASYVTEGLPERGNVAR